MRSIGVPASSRAGWGILAIGARVRLEAGARPLSEPSTTPREMSVAVGVLAQEATEAASGKLSSFDSSPSV